MVPGAEDNLNTAWRGVPSGPGPQAVILIYTTKSEKQIE